MAYIPEGKEECLSILISACYIVTFLKGNKMVLNRVYNALPSEGQNGRKGRKNTFDIHELVMFKPRSLQV
jgi:hypothetical protein